MQNSKWLWMCQVANGCGCVRWQIIVDVSECKMANDCGCVRWQMIVDVSGGKWLWMC